MLRRAVSGLLCCLLRGCLFLGRSLFATALLRWALGCLLGDQRCRFSCGQCLGLLVARQRCIGRSIRMIDGVAVSLHPLLVTQIVVVQSTVGATYTPNINPLAYGLLEISHECGGGANHHVQDHGKYHARSTVQGV